MVVFERRVREDASEAFDLLEGLGGSPALAVLKGGDVVDKEVVVGNNVVSSRKPEDIPAFIRESERLLKQVPVGAR